MKKIIVLCISSIIFAASSSFNVEGMMCGVSCVDKLKAQVNTLEGVKSCNVSFEKGMMTVDYDESKIDGSKILSFFDNDPKYTVSTYEKECDKSSSNCTKPCSSEKKEKVGFFKRMFNWL
tara:strand:+ start:109 stop:468 length:360 start_codon:yes stop_codon:yes gene_type:complete